MNVAAGRRPLARVPTPAVDIAVALAAGAFTIVTSAMVVRGKGDGAIDPLGYGLLAAGALALVVRSAFPVAVVTATTAVTVVFLLRDYPDVPASVPLAVATYSLAARASLRRSLSVTVVAGSLIEVTVAVTEGSGRATSSPSRPPTCSATPCRCDGATWPTSRSGPAGPPSACSRGNSGSAPRRPATG